MVDLSFTAIDMRLRDMDSRIQSILLQMDKRFEKVIEGQQEIRALVDYLTDCVMSECEPVDDEDDDDDFDGGDEDDHPAWKLNDGHSR
jgi:hypothetical protein